MSYFLHLNEIFEDEISLKLFLLVIIISIASCAYSFILGFYFFVLVITSLFLSIILSNNPQRRNQLQSFLNSYLETKKKYESKDTVRLLVAQGLDTCIADFFQKVIDKFITEWYMNVTQDSSFIKSIKYELNYGLRKVAMRYKNVDYASVITIKLLPIVYSHFTEIESYIEEEDINVAIQKFLENNPTIHPATFNRKCEVEYLRSLAENVIPYLGKANNLKCRPVVDILRELLSNMLLLPITDIIADPNTIYNLVILATNPKTSQIPEFSDEEKTQVELLENFIRTNDNGEEYTEDFFKDQEKLYNFMNFLKSKTLGGVDILRFVLDVDHLTSESDKSHKDPIKVSELVSKFEVLLTYYQNYLFHGNPEDKPCDLQSAYNHAKAFLQHKWKHEYYKSAEYYKVVYGDRDIYTIHKAERDDSSISGDQISSQKLSSKIRNAMAMKVIAVDGIEEPDIQVWDALDVAASYSPSYYNSMAVKLRRERGQDLENFMQTFFHSIDQEADIGEDISALLQAKSNLKNNYKQKNAIETFHNLFNIPSTSRVQEVSSFVKTPTQNFLYFLAKIIKIHPIILRLVTGITQFLPDSDSLILRSIRKFFDKLVTQELIAHLVRNLQSEIFDSKPRRYTQQELLERKNLAFERLEKLKSGLSNNLKFLQNPVFNKLLVYSLFDVVITETFPEFKHDGN